NVYQTPLQRYRRIDAFLDPQPQAVEAPGRGPADERAEQQHIDHSAQGPEADPVVVEGEETHAVPGGHVAPVTRALANERLGIIGPELQCRCAFAVSPVALTDRF